MGSWLQREWQRTVSKFENSPDWIQTKKERAQAEKDWQEAKAQAKRDWQNWKAQTSHDWQDLKAQARNGWRSDKAGQEDIFMEYRLQREREESKLQAERDRADARDLLLVLREIWLPNIFWPIFILALIFGSVVSAILVVPLIFVICGWIHILAFIFPAPFAKLARRTGWA